MPTEPGKAIFGKSFEEALSNARLKHGEYFEESFTKMAWIAITTQLMSGLISVGARDLDWVKDEGVDYCIGLTEQIIIKTTKRVDDAIEYLRENEEA